MTVHSLPINIIIVADDPLARAGLASTFVGEDEIRVVAQLEYTDLDESDLLIFEADFLLIDEGWAEGEGYRETSQLIDELPALHLVDPEILESGFHLGKSSVISRESTSGAIKAAIHAVLAGWVVLDPRISSSSSSIVRRDLSEVLTKRENDVLVLISEGLTNRAISNELKISENTVKYHVNSILTKLEAQSRTEAVVIAARAGLIPL
jgi:DNA-binding NarL/FixJ family response regulator